MEFEKLLEKIKERYAGYSLNSGNAGMANEDRGWLLALVERLTRERNKERSAMMEEAAKIAATWDDGGCDCDGYCKCGNLNDATVAAASATARTIANKLRTRAEALKS